MNEVKNITDQYGNSQTYNTYKKILDKNLTITLLKQTSMTHTLGSWERSSQILAHQITNLRQGRKQCNECWVGIPMYDCSGNEGFL